MDLGWILFPFQSLGISSYIVIFVFYILFYLKYFVYLKIVFLLCNLNALIAKYYEKQENDDC